ncbi:MAG TPA: hypothetical protein PKD53_07230, partial [Chloroflexaceae bacterium]|nr:hypothetical protein [Chloroflexaceae bacterium]
MTYTSGWAHIAADNERSGGRGGHRDIDEPPTASGNAAGEDKAEIGKPGTAEGHSKKGGQAAPVNAGHSCLCAARAATPPACAMPTIISTHPVPLVSPRS